MAVVCSPPPQAAREGRPERVLAATDEVSADFLAWLQSRCQAQRILLSQSPVAEHSLIAPALAEESLENLWTALADKPLLDGADLALLSLYHDKFSLEQFASVVERSGLALPADTLEIWRARLIRLGSRGLAEILCYSILMMISTGCSWRRRLHRRCCNSVRGVHFVFLHRASMLSFPVQQ